MLQYDKHNHLKGKLMTQPLKIFLIMMMVIMAGITINTCATAQSTTTLSKFAKFADALTS